MALPSIGGGYQDTDGNQNEIIIGVQAEPQTATATATLTVTQITNDILVGNPSTSAASYTLPTAAAIDAVMTNMKVNSTFMLTVINLGTSSGVITMVVGTGITAVGNLLVAITGSAAGVGGAAQFLFRKTGTAAYTLYRVA
jgi:hypothetical protein